MPVVPALARRPALPDQLTGQTQPGQTRSDHDDVGRADTLDTLPFRARRQRRGRKPHTGRCEQETAATQIRHHTPLGAKYATQHGIWWLT